MDKEFKEIRKQIRKGQRDPNATDEEVALARMWEADQRQRREEDPSNPNRKIENRPKPDWAGPDWDG
jgi:hypothetical protein